MSIQRTSFYILLAVVTIAFFWLLLPYYSAVLWAVILAIIFFPVHRRVEHALKGRSGIASLLTVLLCIFLVILPSMIILGSLIREGSNLYQRINNNEIDFSAYATRIEEALPAFANDWLRSIRLDGFTDLRESVSAAFMQAGQSLAGTVLSLGQNTLQFFIGFGIMLYLMYFFVQGWCGTCQNNPTGNSIKR
jgi:predicted PurR-regulated permease PerM